MRITFFVDFDGTITKKDTGLAMSEAFAVGDWEGIEKKWADGSITTVECVRGLFGLFDADHERLIKLLHSIEIDGFFISFLRMCREKGYGIYILSDGFDINIKTILGKHGIHDVPYYSNEMIISGGNFDIRTPYSSASCNDCGTCKTELFHKLKPADGITVYIGDGLSDTCASKEADVVFGKDRLLEYRKDHGLSVIPFDDFSDILQWEKHLSDA